ncbi:O-antigen ligase family protein [Vibrio cyclitrophicus]|uniref:O-antigen ligase family protein n=1 Tax=Vibrio cyclitrophicus TaxID=47951 RepID=UPI0013015053|nr:O-antigen ligase family protein [Vibrio cyclitrophicus]
MILICIILLIFYNYIRITRAINPVLWAFVVCIPFNYILYLNVFGANDSHYLGWRFQGARDNPNLLAVNMLISIYCCLTLIRMVRNNILKCFLVISVLLSSHLIILTASKKGMFLGFFIITIGFILYLFDTKQKKIKLPVIFILAFSLLYFFYDNIVVQFLSDDAFINAFGRIQEFFNSDGTSTNNRIKYILSGIDLFSMNPIFGNGIDEFRNLYGIYSHSNIIEVLSGTGLIGFIIYYSIYFTLIVSIFKLNDKVSRYSLLSITFLLLINEVSMVSYYSKFSLFILLTISLLATDFKRK